MNSSMFFILNINIVSLSPIGLIAIASFRILDLSDIGYLLSPIFESPVNEYSQTPLCEGLLNEILV